MKTGQAGNQRKGGAEESKLNPRADSCFRLSSWVFYSGLALGALAVFPECFYERFELPKLFFVQLAAVIIIFLWLLSAFYRRVLILRFPACLMLLGVVFLIAVASIGWSLNPGLAVERLYHVGTLAAYLLFSFGLYRGKDTRKALYFIVFTGSALAVWGLALDFVEPLRKAVYPHFIGELTPGYVVDRYRKLTSNQGNPNYLMHILVLTTPLAFGALIRELSAAGKEGSYLSRRFLEACLAFSLLAQSLCFFSTMNRSSMFAVFLALFFFAFSVLLLVRKQLINMLKGYLARLVYLFSGIVLATVLLIYFTDTGRSLANSAVSGARTRLLTWQERLTSLKSTENINVYSRVIFIETGWKMIVDNPLKGKGIGQFVIWYPKYKTEKHWEKFGLIGPEIKRWEEIPPQAHNEYLQLFIELGLFAFIAFLAFWFLFARAFWRYLKSQVGQPEFYLTLGAGAGVLGTLFNALFTFPLQTVTSAVFFYSVSGLILALLSRNDSGKFCRETGFSVPLARPLSRAAVFAAAAIILSAGIWSSFRIVRGQYVFFDALKTHAHDLAYSIRRNDQAGKLLPYHFEIQYVQGWLNQLNGDSTQARIHYERSIELAPFFPEPYRYLVRFYFANGDYVKTEKILRRYNEIYAPGVPGDYQMIWGQILLADTTRDRIAEADSHLRKAGGSDALFDLAAGYLQRNMFGSALSILRGLSREEPERERDIRFFLNVEFAYGFTAYRTGDSALARKEIEKVIKYSGDNDKDFVEKARFLLQRLDAAKK